VSIAANGNATVAWQIDTTPDTEWYYILHLEGGNWTLIDSVQGIQNTFYQTSINAEGGPETFRVYAADSCQNPSAWSLEMHTEYVSAELDACQSLIRVHWNAYINWPAGVSYALYRSMDGGAPVLVGVTTDTLLEDADIVQNSQYCYTVVAVDAGSSGARTSTSNSVCVLAEIPRAPDFNYITTATVTAPNTVLVKAYADPAADAAYYKIMRSAKYGGPYQQVGSVPYTGSTLISYTDLTAQTDESSYYYRVVVTDTCGVDIDTSEVGRTILLTAVRNDNFTNTLSWNEYEIWLGGVSYYTLYRSVDGVQDGVPLVSAIAPGNTVYIDNIIDKALTSEGEFCYYLMAFEGLGNAYGFRDTSTSNVACVTAAPVVFIPNAFTPSSARSEMNAQFNPFKIFVNAASYSMRIFDRFGEEIFLTNDTQVGWDGTYKGQPVQGGVYVYLVKMIGSDGTKIERRGTVTLIR
jgi:gliding motility-associated-like protein